MEHKQKCSEYGIPLAEFGLAFAQVLGVQSPQRGHCYACGLRRNYTRCLVSLRGGYLGVGSGEGLFIPRDSGIGPDSGGYDYKIQGAPDIYYRDGGTGLAVKE